MNLSEEFLFEETNDINDMISAFSAELDELSKNVPPLKNYKNAMTPIIISGIKDNDALKFLFSPTTEHVIEKLIDNILSGDFENLVANIDIGKKMFDTAGVGDGLFKGIIGQSIVENIQQTMNAEKFMKLKSKFLKIRMLLKNLEKQKKLIQDPVTKEKYEDAVYAIKQAVKMIIKIYRNRKLINARVINGLKNIVVESEEIPIVILKI